MKFLVIIIFSLISQLSNADSNEVLKTALDFNKDKLKQDYNYKKITNLLTDIKTLKTFPFIENNEDDEFCEVISKAEIDELNLNKVIKVFYSTQTLFFENKLIELEICRNDIGFRAAYLESKVYFQLDLIKEIISAGLYSDPMNVFKYISAHEISHFVHEVSTHRPFSQELGLSIHRNISSYQPILPREISKLSFNDQIRIGSGDIYGQEILKRIITQLVPSGLRTHAEVDVLATMVLKIDNFDAWNDVFKFINKSKQGRVSGAVMDFDNRLRVIKETLVY